MRNIAMLSLMNIIFAT
jgi:hypothetical protein